jgi:1-acyl-sn-glycerol-3-phosphate acyltransferase
MHGLTIRLTGDLPADPVIYVSNHLGYIDPVVLCSLTPCSPIAKAEVAGWPCIGTLARRMNVIFVQRGDTASETRGLRLAMRRLQAGVSVLNFPEGTTTRGDMRQFRRGIFGLSALMQVPVVPLAVSFDELGLCWVDDESLLGHYSTAVMRRAHFIDVQAGPPMLMGASETPTAFALRVRRWIATARGPHAERQALPISAEGARRSRSWPVVDHSAA